MRPESSKEAPVMASNNNNGKENNEGMQDLNACYLPLVFANGSPISLEFMKLVSIYFL